MWFWGLLVLVIAVTVWGFTGAAVDCAENSLSLLALAAAESQPSPHREPPGGGLDQVDVFDQPKPKLPSA